MKVGLLLLPNERLARPSLLIYSIFKTIKKFLDKKDDFYLVILDKTSAMINQKSSSEIVHSFLKYLGKLGLDFNNIHIVYDSDINSDSYSGLLTELFSRLNYKEKEMIFNYLKKDSKIFAKIFSYLIVQDLCLDKIIITKDKLDLYNVMLKKISSLPKPYYIENVFDSRGKTLFNSPNELYLDDSSESLALKLERYNNLSALNSALTLFDIVYTKCDLNQKKSILFDKIISASKEFRHSQSKNNKLFFSNRDKIVKAIKILSKPKISMVLKSISEKPMCIAEAARFTGYSYVTMHHLFSQLHLLGILKKEDSDDKRKEVYSLFTTNLEINFPVY